MGRSPKRAEDEISEISSGYATTITIYAGEITPAPVAPAAAARPSSSSYRQEEEGHDPHQRNTSPFEIHQVRLPPRVSTLHKLKHRLCEIFFPDDPARIFKNQPLPRKIILGLQYFFPILQWSRGYTLKLFRSDLLAGLTIASLAIPQGISYAKLANLPPIIGLYSSFVPPLIYSVLGSSKHVGIGPVSIASLVLGSMLSEQVSPSDQRELYVQLAFTATLFAGIFQAALGLLRLGFVIEFLSKPTLIGYMSGAAIVVALQQLKGLLDIDHFTSKMQIVPVLESVFHHTKEWSWKTVVMSVCFLIILLAAKQISAKKPKLFWISAIAPLACVIISTIIVYVFKSKFRDISKIGHLPKGVNPSSVSKLYFHGPYLSLAIKMGIMIGILTLTEGIATGRTLASMEGYQIDGNKEMMAFGLMNISGCLCSCYVATGSFSRSAVNYNAGAKTVGSNIVMAVAVLVTLLFLMPLFRYTPNLVLASIILTAVLGLIDIKGAYRMWKLDKLDFVAFLCSFFGVVFLSVQIGLAIAVGVSLFKIILHVTRPATVALGNIPGTEIYQSLDRYENASRVPSFLILSIESPIFFTNSTYLQERIIRWIGEEESRINDNGGKEVLKCIILDMTAVSNIDTSGIDAITELRKTMDRRSLQVIKEIKDDLSKNLVLVNPVGVVTEKLHHSKVLELFRSDGLYLTIAEAIIAVSSSWKNWPLDVEK